MARTVAGSATVATDVARNGAGVVTGTGATQVLVTANPQRVKLLVQAQGAGGVWIALGTAAAANTGIKGAQNQVIDLSGFQGQVNVLAVGAELVTFLEV
jgi:hypothetical protein